MKTSLILSILLLALVLPVTAEEPQKSPGPELPNTDVGWYECQIFERFPWVRLEGSPEVDRYRLYSSREGQCDTSKAGQFILYYLRFRDNAQIWAEWLIRNAERGVVRGYARDMLSAGDTFVLRGASNVRYR
jgi:hypothetical protein